MREKNRFQYPEAREELKQMGPLRNLRELIERCANLYEEKVIFSEKIDGIIISYGARKLEEDVKALASALLNLSLPSRNIAIVGENSYAWVVSYFAIVCSGLVAVPLDKELTDEDLAKQVKKADVCGIVHSATFTYCVDEIKKENPNVQFSIGIRDEGRSNASCTFSEMIKEGKKLQRKKQSKYNDVKLDSEEMCEIIFTSGTMGANKGVMLSQKNICTVVNAIVEIMPIDESTFSVLPISHTYEKNCNILGAIYLGAHIYFNDSLRNLIGNMELFQPKMSCMVPLFLETLYKNIWTTAEKRELISHLKWGLKVSKFTRHFGIDLRKTFFRPVISAFGGKFHFIVCGGAPLRPDVLKGLSDFGIDVVNGYGITECAPLVSVNLNTNKHRCSIGKPIPEVQVKIGKKDEDGLGEILVKGDNVMLGYYKEPGITKDSFDEDGWFKTGDYGKLDRAGNVYITGRKKNLIILDNGKNVNPEELETIIMDNIICVKEVVVHAVEKKSQSNRLQMLAAEVFMEPEYIENYDEDKLNEMISEEIQKVNRKLPGYKQIQYIGISDNEFEKTSSKKIKRYKVIESVQQNKKLKIAG